MTKHFRFWIFDQNVPLALLLGVAVFHLGVWTFGPMALLGNLHQDTLEIVYWSRDLALGYPKHPPLAPFLVHVFLQSGRFGIFSLMVLSQIGFVITALYCAGVRQIVPQTRLKICVFCAVLLSPMSGIFGVQLNHNSLLMPAWAGCLYYGFAYLEQGRWRDGLGLALAAAIGAWLKYEIAFVLIGLLGVSLLWAPYRHVWRRPASYVGVVLFALLLAPHLWWLFYVDSSPLTYALEMQASDKVSALGRLNNFVVGLGVCLIGVGVVLGVMRCLGLRIILQWRLSAASLACALSLLALVVMSLITHQGIRQGWVIPFTPSVILAVASWVRIDAPDEDWRWPRLLYASAGMSAVMALLFAGFVIWRAQGQKPIASYSFDGERLTAAVVQQWAPFADRPLACLMVDEHYTSVAPLVWLHDQPHVVDFSVPYWSRPQQKAYCNEHGGVIVHRRDGADVDYASSFPHMCTQGRTTVSVGARFAQGERWVFDLTLVPPQGQACPASTVR